MRINAVFLFFNLLPFCFFPFLGGGYDAVFPFFNLLPFYFFPFFIIFAADFVSLMNNELLSSLW